MDSPEPVQVMTVKELSQALGLCEETVKRRFRDGTLKGFRLGRSWKMSRAEFARLLSQDQKEGASG